MDGKDDQIDVKELNLSKKPIVYCREFDFRGMNPKILEKYQIRPVRYLYIGSHKYYHMKDRSRFLRAESLNNYKGTKVKMLGRMYPHYKEWYLNEVDPTATDDFIEDIFFYGHVTYFFVDTPEESHVLETQLTNQAKVIQCLNPEDVTLLMSPRSNDGSIKLKKLNKSIKLLPKNSRNGSKFQPVRIDLVDQNLILDYESILNYIKYLGVKDQAEIYKICYQLINADIIFNNKVLKVDSENFTDIFTKLVDSLK